MNDLETSEITREQIEQWKALATPGEWHHSGRTVKDKHDVVLAEMANERPWNPRCGFISDAEVYANAQLMAASPALRDLALSLMDQQAADMRLVAENDAADSERWRATLEQIAVLTQQRDSCRSALEAWKRDEAKQRALSESLAKEVKLSCIEMGRADRINGELTRRAETAEAEAKRLREACEKVRDWLMSDDDGAVLNDSEAWSKPFRDALNAVRAALATEQQEQPR